MIKIILIFPCTLFKQEHKVVQQKHFLFRHGFSSPFIGANSTMKQVFIIPYILIRGFPCFKVHLMDTESLINILYSLDLKPLRKLRWKV